MIYLLYSPLFYVNGMPHVGHRFNLAIINCYGRFLYTKGLQVIKYTGTDEHGDKIAACVDGSYKQYLANMRQEFGKIFTGFNVYNTDNEYHVAYVKFVFNKLKKQGIIYEGNYKGYYCTREERYLNKSEYDPNNLADSVSFREEKGFFMKIDKEINKNLIAHIDKIVVGQHYHKEIIHLLENTEDVFISRRRRHDALVPIDDTQDLSFYVWFDAINYYNLISSLFIYRQINIKNFIGCDILRFHVVLLLHLSYYLFRGFIPYNFVVHGMLKQDDVKISKTYHNFQEAEAMEKAYGSLFHAALISNGINGTIVVNKNKLDSYYANIKNNVRNFYSRMIGINKLFAGYRQVKTMSLLYVNHYHNSELTKIVEKLAQFNCEDFTAIYSGLNSLAKEANGIINNQKLWEFDEKKIIAFLECKLYMKYMLICEYILGHDIEIITTKLKMEMWSSLINMYSDDLAIDQLDVQDVIL